MIPEFARPIETAALEALGRTAARVHEEGGLETDLYEGEAEYLVVVDAPGAEAPDVQTRFLEDTLEVRIDRFRAFREEFELRYPGRGVTLSARVPLPADATVDPEGATATLQEDGTVWVRLPKAPAGEAS